MAADTQAAALAGLDSLELQPPRSRDYAAVPVRVWNALWPKLLAIAIVLAVWQLVYTLKIKAHDIFPGPATVLSYLWGQLQHAQLWNAIETTLERAVVSFGAAVVVGSVIGAVVSRIGPLRAAVGSMITGLQTMPSIAWIPFALIFFGPNDAAILFVVILGAAPSVANGLIAGVDYTPPLLLRAGKTMGLRGLALWRHLILPASLPAYVAGLKQGWAFGWRSLMAAELLVIVANQPSIGVLLNNFQDLTDMTGAISIMIVILILGIVVDSLFNTADRALRRRRGLSDATVGT